MHRRRGSDLRTQGRPPQVLTRIVRDQVTGVYPSLQSATYPNPRPPTNAHTHRSDQIRSEHEHRWTIPSLEKSTIWSNAHRLDSRCKMISVERMGFGGQYCDHFHFHFDFTFTFVFRASYAKEGKCLSDCQLLWLFLPVFGLVMLFTFTTSMPALSATLRYVCDSHTRTHSPCPYQPCPPPSGMRARNTHTRTMSMSALAATLRYACATPHTHTHTHTHTHDATCLHALRFFTADVFRRSRDRSRSGSSGSSSAASVRASPHPSQTTADSAENLFPFVQDLKGNSKGSPSAKYPQNSFGPCPFVTFRPVGNDKTIWFCGGGGGGGGAPSATNE